MNAKKLLGAFLAGGPCLVTVTATTSAYADKSKPKDTASTPPPDPPVAKKNITLPYSTLSFGMSPSRVADQIDKILDEDYKPLYKATSPGVRMKALDAQLAEDKAIFRRSKVDFGKIPTGVDGTPLRGEFTYNNKEAMMTLTRQGETSSFFFIQDKLWKIIVEKTFSDTSASGKNYNDGVTKIATSLGVAGRILPADTTHPALEVDWKDSSIHFRVIQRGEKAGGFAYVDLSTESSLPSLRTAKIVEDNGIDPAVAAAMRKPDPGPEPPKDDKKKRH